MEGFFHNSFGLVGSVTPLFSLLGTNICWPCAWCKLYYSLGFGSGLHIVVAWSAATKSLVVGCCLCARRAF